MNISQEVTNTYHKRKADVIVYHEDPEYGVHEDPEFIPPSETKKQRAHQKHSKKRVHVKIEPELRDHEDMWKDVRGRSRNPQNHSGFPMKPPAINAQTFVDIPIVEQSCDSATTNHSLQCNIQSLFQHPLASEPIAPSLPDVTCASIMTAPPLLDAPSGSCCERRPLSYEEQRKILGARTVSQSPLATHQTKDYGMPNLSVPLDPEMRALIRKHRTPRPGCPFTCAVCRATQQVEHIDTRCGCENSEKVCFQCVLTLFTDILSPKQRNAHNDLPTMVVEVDLEGQLEYHVLVSYQCRSGCGQSFDMVYRRYPLLSLGEATNETYLTQCWIWRILNRKKVSAQISKFIPRETGKVAESFECFYQRKLRSLRNLLEYANLPTTVQDHTRVYICAEESCRNVHLVKPAQTGSPFPPVVRCESCHHVFCHCGVTLGPKPTVNSIVVHSQHIPLRRDWFGPAGEWTPWSEMTLEQRNRLVQLLDARVRDYACAICPSCGVGRTQLESDSHVQCPLCQRRFCFFCQGAFASDMDEYRSLRHLHPKGARVSAFAFGHLAKIFKKKSEGYAANHHNVAEKATTELQRDNLNRFLSDCPSVNESCVRYLRCIPYYEELVRDDPAAVNEHYRRFRVLYLMRVLRKQWGREKFVTTYFKTATMQNLPWLQHVLTQADRDWYAASSAS
jgi:hypothetical protein